MSVNRKKGVHDIVRLTLNLFEKKDNDEYGIEKYIVHRYPKNIEKNRIGYTRPSRVAKINEGLEKAYASGKKMLHKKATSNQNQERYAFNNDIKGILCKGIEVSCRMVTLTPEDKKYKIFRIGDISFKGEMKNIIDKLIERSIRELVDRFQVSNTAILSTACYGPSHQMLNCELNCKKITQKTFNRHKGIFTRLAKPENGTEEKGLDSVCYSKRQLLGQCTIPFIAESPDEEENDDEVFVFDNLFMNNDGTLSGINRPNIPLDGPNFFDTVDSLTCNALMTFNFMYVGVTRSGINLYLDTTSKNKTMYCTKANTHKELPEHASQYLEELCFSNPKLKNLLKEKKGIDLDDDDLFGIEFHEPKSKRLKDEKDAVLHEEEQENEDESENVDEMTDEDECEKNKDGRQDEKECEEEEESVYETRRKQMIAEI